MLLTHQQGLSTYCILHTTLTRLLCLINCTFTDDRWSMLIQHKQPKPRKITLNETDIGTLCRNCPLEESGAHWTAGHIETHDYLDIRCSHTDMFVNTSLYVNSTCHEDGGII